MKGWAAHVARVQHERVQSSEDAPTPDGQSAWADAARRCAVRLLEDRGVSDSWSVTQESGSLWVNYDRLRVRVGDDSAEVTSEQELFEKIDSWVAHERPAGPGRWLSRDAAAVREEQQLAHRCIPWWRGAAVRLAADLKNAWGVATVWEVTESQVDLPWPGEDQLTVLPPDDEEREGIWVTEIEPGEAATVPPPASATGRMPWPEIKILMTAADGSGTGHTASYWELTSEEDAIDELATLFEAALIEELWGYWPTCPAHDFALAITRVDGVATWWCTEAGQPLTAVGSLTRNPHAPISN